MEQNHGLPFEHPIYVYDGGYNDITDCSVIIITVGANQNQASLGYVFNFKPD